MDECLVRAWEDGVFDERERAVVAGRLEGRTLDEVGEALGLSRERARQIQSRARKRLTKVADLVQDNWREKAHATGMGPATPRAAFATALGFVDHMTLDELLAAAGLKPPRTWAGPLRGWWSVDADALGGALRRLTDTAPFRSDELGRAAAEVGLPAALPLEELLIHSGSRLALSPDGHWVRRRARGRDAAYLWLLETGRPCQADELIAPMAATTVASVREALRRDDRFRAIRPEGTWALTEWTHLRASPSATAVEAMVTVVTESGPLSRARLFARVTELYPVTPWRLKQCLLSDQLGETPDGLVDLVSRGARAFEEEEPARPDMMAVEGEVLGVRIPVTPETLRGSGVRVHTWLTWRLGLRRAPMSRTFTTPGDHAPLVVRRGTSSARLSSLRRHALELEVVDGCSLAVLLRLDDDTARVGHGCAPGDCPARQVRASVSALRPSLSDSAAPPPGCPGLQGQR
ncbi:sigma factor-like helix-turn-helix DNA-binding protein [Actinocorallia sp. A-T 12471]|uniref:sigma factor-like helix-turn-helix DNA-binding protein n=1 Tax=Actinocorallia sp. A-T 12471 TaxID=3089813 RepID=UPI0029D202C9|nr:sigma factor-like helix-turn-helix DNA-binding protein [Actinocorallia sp. A-T 12471]MDX6742618.1 sigma factor-like helix-turn-helix DNA-binding protein [Actinocorallia sp. A-T 12471]